MGRPSQLPGGARRACCLVLLAGCAAVDPRAVSPDLSEPLFEPGWLLRGTLSLEPALCSLATVGLDVTVLPRELPPPEHTRGLAEACRDAAEALAPSSTGSRGEWVHVGGAEAWAADPLRLETRRTDVLAVLHRPPAPRGIAILFTGLAMPADSEVFRRFADGFVRRGWIAVLDFVRVGAHLDGAFHDISTDAMQTYFQRIMAGRYGVAPVRFQRTLQRAPPTGRMTSLDTDVPSAWLCQGPVERTAVFLSRTDPVLGDAQRSALEAQGFPFQRTPAAGHIPLACDLSLFDLLVDTATGVLVPDARRCEPPRPGG